MSLVVTHPVSAHFQVTNMCQSLVNRYDMLALTSWLVGSTLRIVFIHKVSVHVVLTTIQLALSCQAVCATAPDNYHC